MSRRTLSVLMVLVALAGPAAADPVGTDDLWHDILMQAAHAPLACSRPRMPAPLHCVAPAREEPVTAYVPLSRPAHSGQAARR